MFTLSVPGAALIAAPANDAFEKATVLSGRTITLLSQTGAKATANALDPYVGSPATRPVNSVWYRFDAPFTTTNVRLLITDESSPGALSAGVFRLLDPDGGSGSLVSVQQVTSPAPGILNTLTFDITLGQRFYICVNTPGVFSFTLKIPGPTNDYFEDARVLAGDSGTITGSNENAANEGDLPDSVASSLIEAGVWFTWTPGFSGPAIVDTNFSEHALEVPHDTFLTVYTGTTLGNLVVVASDDDGGHKSNSKVTFTASAGTTYTIWLGTSGASKRGNYMLSYYPDTSPGEFFLQLAPSVSENQGRTSVILRRLRPGISASVNLSVTAPLISPAATSGVDFTVFSNATLTLVSGSEEFTFFGASILADNLAEPTEHFDYVLSAPTAGAVLGSPSRVGVSILDQSGTEAPQFLTSSISVRESDGSITIPVQRNGGLGGAVQISLIAGQEDDTARAGVNYTFPSGTNFSLAPFQSRLDIPVSIINDGVYDGRRTFTLTLASTTPGVTASGITSIKVTIEDDDMVVPAAGRVVSFHDSGGIAGNADFTVSAAGAVTGKVAMARGVFSFRGVLDAAGYLVARLGPATGPLRTIQIQLLNSAARTYQVTLNDGDMGSTSTATRTATNFTALAPCPMAGRYTFADDGVPGVPQQMAGIITVSSLGSATLSGKLFDGTAVVASGAVNAINVVNLGASLYAGKGRVTAAATLPTSTGLAATSVMFNLLRPGRANQTIELSAIDSTSSGLVAKYVPPPINNRILSVWSTGTGYADLSGGGFTALTTKALLISTASKVAVTTPQPEKLALTLSPGTGLFTGSLIPTGATKSKPIYGVLLQVGASSVGRGFFLNGITPGGVVLRGP